MPAAGGIEANLALAEEVTPGTAVTVNRFFELEKETLIDDIDRAEHSGLRLGRKVQGYDNWRAAREKPGGPIDLTIQNKGMAVWFKHALGSVTTTTPGGGTTSRQHLCKVGVIDGKSLTVQAVMYSDAGAAVPKTLAGCKIDKWSVEIKENDFPSLLVTIDAMGFTTATGAAAPSYAAGMQDYFGTDAVVKIAGAEVDCSSFKLDVDNGLMTERYYLRSTTPNMKKEQLEGDKLREMKGHLSLAFPDLTAYNRFKNAGLASIQVTLTGSIIEAAIPYSFDITIPSARFDGTTPNIDGVGLIPVELDFVVVDNNDTNGPLVVTIVNTDTAA